MACECISKMNAKLAERNSRLIGTLCWPRKDEEGKLADPYEVVTLQCEKIVPRNRDKCVAIATFCPFCGVKYVAE